MYAKMQIIHPAYVAGFFDGEAYFHLHWEENKKRKMLGVRPFISVSIHKKERHLLELLHNQYGGTLSEYPSDKKRNAVTLRFSGEKSVGKILNDILPYLILKKRQGELLSEAIRIKQKTPFFSNWIQREDWIKLAIIQKEICGLHQKNNQRLKYTYEYILSRLNEYDSGTEKRRKEKIKTMGGKTRFGGNKT